MALQTHPGVALQARRQTVGLTREALGQRAGGVSASTIKRIERGQVRPHPATVAAVERVLVLAERAANRTAALNDHEPAADGPVEKVRDDPAQSGE